MLEHLVGVCDVIFVGKLDLLKICIKAIWRNSYGEPLYIEDIDGAVYNWLHIISISKAV